MQPYDEAVDKFKQWQHRTGVVFDEGAIGPGLANLCQYLQQFATYPVLAGARFTGAAVNRSFPEVVADVVALVDQVNQRAGGGRVPSVAVGFYAYCLTEQHQPPVGWVGEWRRTEPEAENDRADHLSSHPDHEQLLTTGSCQQTDYERYANSVRESAKSNDARALSTRWFAYCMVAHDDGLIWNSELLGSEQEAGAAGQQHASEWPDHAPHCNVAQTLENEYEAMVLQIQTQALSNPVGG